ncbi:MAG: hypothetical protein SGARI_001380, partial [Bacillariaceae sp.]
MSTQGDSVDEEDAASPPSTPTRTNRRRQQQLLDEKLKQEALEGSPVSETHQYRYNDPDTHTVVSSSTSTSRKSARPGVDQESVDRPEDASVSTASTGGEGNSLIANNNTTPVVYTKSRTTRPSRLNQCVVESFVSQLEPVRPGVEFVPGSPSRNDTLIVDSSNTMEEGTFPAAAAAAGVSAPSATTVTTDVEVGSAVQAQPIDEEEYRQRIENEYRNRLLREAVTSSSGADNAPPEVPKTFAPPRGSNEPTEDKQTASPAADKGFRMTKRWWMLLAAGLVVVAVVAIGVAVAATRPDSTPPAPTPGSVENVGSFTEFCNAVLDEYESHSPSLTCFCNDNTARVECAGSSESGEFLNVELKYYAATDGYDGIHCVCQDFK